jgi:hypothetical protein
VFDVASGGSLTLENVTLQNGRVTSPFPGATQEGGAIFNQGSLVLSEVMIQNNSAQGWRGTAQPAAGGGIWSDGTLTVENSTVFQGNSAFGGSGTYTTGGNAYGGAICIAGGTADISDSFFGSYNSASRGKGNTAQAGGYAPYFHSAYGGAVYIAAGTVTMTPTPWAVRRDNLASNRTVRRAQRIATAEAFTSAAAL